MKLTESDFAVCLFSFFLQLKYLMLKLMQDSWQPVVSVTPKKSWRNELNLKVEKLSVIVTYVAVNLFFGSVFYVRFLKHFISGYIIAFT